MLPAVGAHLEVPQCTDVLGLPASSRYVVVLIDGLGRRLLGRSADLAPFLSGLVDLVPDFTAGVPSTTATSLTSFGTGLPPGRHGIVGYSCRMPETGAVLNTLAWDADVDPVAFQPRPTLLERAAAAGVRVTSVGPVRFERSGLTRAGLRGADYHGVREDSPVDHRVAAVSDAATRSLRTLVYAYERRLDHAGHGHGCGSREWRAELARVDAFCSRLRAALPSDVTLLITGDHGMVDVPPERQILVEDVAGLADGVAVLAGEGRFRQLYLDGTERPDPQAAVRLAARWSAVLGERAWVRTRAEAVAEGWFGTQPETPVLERYGDVLVAMREDWAVLTRALPRELALVGMHGSLTANEMSVPLLSG